MTFSRRSLLAFLAGAPLAASACKRAPVPGSIRGGAMAVGHRLRDATVEQASGPPLRVKVAIVGAGPSGLSAAWRLERLGEPSFVVLELEPQAGGTSAFGTDGVVPHPWGAHYVPLPSADNPALVALLDELGVLESRSPVVAKETARVRAPEERVFADGAWHEGLLPRVLAGERDVAELRRFEQDVERWVRFRDARGRPAFALPSRRSSDAAEVVALDRLTASAYLDRLKIHSSWVRWYVEYACRDDYGLSLEQTSAWAMLFYFASRATSAGQSAPFLTFPEGNGRLVRHLGSVAGARLRLGQLVTDVVPSEGEVALTSYDVASGRLTRVVAEQVILAIPKFVVRRVLRPYRDSPPAHLSQLTYGVWVVSNVHLSGRPKSRGFELAWDNVIYDSASLGYVVATHQSLRDQGPSVWTHYLPLIDAEPDVARRRVAEATHDELASAVLADLEPAHVELRRHVERVDVWRWGHAMVRAVPDTIWSAGLAKARRPLGRVHFAHADLSGLPLFEEAQDHGVRAAEDVLTALGREVARWT
ncbi:MAG: FAD-dependent oxidoreductase [Polyangiaceae bacterium]|nr:FAD-dependent oxidoreductase [Polyangiaceae bacterium]